MRSTHPRQLVVIALVGTSLLGEQLSGRTPTPQDSCSAVLDGSKYPDLIPDAVAWAVIGGQVSAGTFRQTAQTLGVSGAGADVIARMFAGGGAPITGPTAALTKRDLLTRQLSTGDYQVLRDWVETERRQMLFTFPVPGRLSAASPEGNRRCTLEVKGKDHPEWIPESFYWEAYFRTQVDAVGEYRVGGRIAPIYLKTHQQLHLPMPVEDLRIFFEIADRTVAQLGGGSGDSRRNAEIVRNAREDLVRRLRESSWRVVLADATSRVRDAAVFAFPTGL
jgi:hypothetical protein